MFSCSDCSANEGINMCQFTNELIRDAQDLGAIQGGFNTRLKVGHFQEQREFTLVVEDDPGVKDLTRDILERYGQNVLTAGSGADALKFCRQRGDEIAVVFLDVVVLETAGVDVLQQMLHINPAVKVVITSIYDLGWDISRVLDRGAVGFLKKPYRMTDLLRVVNQVKKIQ